MAADELMTQLHQWVAYTSVGPLTVRGQTSPGLIATFRQLFGEIDLQELAARGPSPSPE